MYRPGGSDQHTITHGTLPYGANFAVRRRILGDMPFRTDLGVLGSRRLKGEETFFLAGLLDAGHGGYHLPDAVVSHMTVSSRLTYSFILKYAWGAGCSRAVAGIAKRPPARRWALWYPNWYIRALLREAVVTLLTVRTQPKCERVAALYVLSRRFGEVREWLSMA